MQTVFDDLNRLQETKKKQLNDRYVDTWTWLNDELDIIAQLIKRDCVDTNNDSSSQTAPTSNDVRNSSSSSMEIVSQEKDSSSKRKFPDAHLGSSLLSPEQKRLSADLAELQIKAGNYNTKFDDYFYHFSSV